MDDPLYHNKDHKCRNDLCRGPMPLPQMYGKLCPSCGKRQPTISELKSRIAEPLQHAEVTGAPV